MSAVVDKRACRPFAHPAEHLCAELALLEARLRREVRRLRAARLSTDDDFRGLYVSDAHVDAILAPDGETADLHEIDEVIDRLRGEIDARTATSDRRTLPLLRLAESFELSPLEAGVVVATVAVDVDPRFAIIFSYAQNDVTRKRPTTDLLARVLNGGDTAPLRRALAPDATLIARRLVRFAADAHDPEPPWPLRALRADDAVTDWLLGGDRIDAAVPSGAMIASCRSADDLILPDAMRQHLAPLLEHAPATALFVLTGPAGAGRTRITEAICASAGRPLLVADCAASRDHSDWLDVLSRDATLRGAAVLLRSFDAMPASDGAADAIQGLERLTRDVPLVFVATETEWHPPYGWNGSPPVAIDVPSPPPGLRAALWKRSLGAVLDGAAGQIDAARLGSTFSLTPGRIEAAVRAAAHAAALRGEPPDAAAITEAVRTTAAGALQRLAQRLPLFYRREDIVLPARSATQIDAMCRSFRHRETVYGSWGFRRARPAGAGLKVLFAGPSGTGKTMAAQIVARELGLDLYVVDVATIVDKYIGETEKHLRALFAEAARVNGAILFDEADALFGKRSQVQDAHDRYANIEVGFLLQQLEVFDGVAILATNLRANMDDAFMRRLDAVVDFPTPDPANRERIWRSMLTGDAPLGADIDLPFLAERFDLSGGNIRNCAVAAAFAAADGGRAIGMHDLVTAVASEYQKIGKLPSRTDFGPFFDALGKAAP